MDNLLWPHLHLYPQPYNHADAWMVGDRESLTAIRDAITRVLDGPDAATSVRAFCEDGEGYAFIVMRQEDPEVWRRMLLPYAELDVQDPNGTHPSSEVPKAVYRDLVLRLNKEREGA